MILGWANDVQVSVSVSSTLSYSSFAPTATSAPTGKTGTHSGGKRLFASTLYPIGCLVLFWCLILVFSHGLF
jgi:hypothetical protein